VKFRITIRNDDIELRGYIKNDSALRASELVHQMGEAMQPLSALVIVSPVDDDYDPFALDQL
jgi:hypothetical protein